MAHYAKLNNGIVEQVIVADTKEWCESVLGGEWVQTSYNTRGGVHTQGATPLRKNYAGVGYTYNTERDAFIPPQPYPSWTLNEETCLWEAPIPRIGEKDGFGIVWTEEKTDWEYTPFKETNIWQQ